MLHIKVVVRNHSDKQLIDTLKACRFNLSATISRFFMPLMDPQFDPSNIPLEPRILSEEDRACSAHLKNINFEIDVVLRQDALLGKVNHSDLLQYIIEAFTDYKLNADDVHLRIQSVLSVRES